MTLLAQSEPFNWTVLLPVVAGGLAVWYLLPSPHVRRARYGGLLGLLALAGAAGFLFRGLGERIPETVEAVLFFGFSGLAVVFAVLMITNRNPARSALAFAVVVLSTCGLFLLLAAPFLMAATIVIYAGAIIVTFLFVIMLSQQEGPSNANLRTREPALSTAAGFVLLATFLVGLQRVYDWGAVDRAIADASALEQADKVAPDYLSPAGPLDVDNVGTHPAPPLTDKARVFVDEMRAALDRVKVAAPRSPDDRRLTDHRLVQDVDNAVKSLEVSGFLYRDEEDVRHNARTIARGLRRLKAMRNGTGLAHDVNRSGYGTAEVIRPSEYGDAGLAQQPPEPTDDAPHQLPAANVSAVGRTLFADHLLAVELAGTLLLIATVGAIAIAGTRRERAE